MAIYHFIGIKQKRKETKEERKKRIQAQFLIHYNNYIKNLHNDSNTQERDICR